MQIKLASQKSANLYGLQGAHADWRQDVGLCHKIRHGIRIG